MSRYAFLQCGKFEDEDSVILIPLPAVHVTESGHYAAVSAACAGILRTSATLC
jgi:hypothetical protein